MRGNHQGVLWVKTQHSNPAKGFTTIIVDGCEVKFKGHMSNAKAWNHIDRCLKQPNVITLGGAIVTKNHSLARALHRSVRVAESLEQRQAWWEANQPKESK